MPPLTHVVVGHRHLVELFEHALGFFGRQRLDARDLAADAPGLRLRPAAAGSRSTPRRPTSPSGWRLCGRRKSLRSARRSSAIQPGPDHLRHRDVGSFFASAEMCLVSTSVFLVLLRAASAASAPRLPVAPVRRPARPCCASSCRSTILAPAWPLRSPRVRFELHRTCRRRRFLLRAAKRISAISPASSAPLRRRTR